MCFNNPPTTTPLPHSQATSQRSDASPSNLTHFAPRIPFVKQNRIIWKFTPCRHCLYTQATSQRSEAALSLKHSVCSSPPALRTLVHALCTAAAEAARLAPMVSTAAAAWDQNEHKRAHQTMHPRRCLTHLSHAQMESRSQEKVRERATAQSNTHTHTHARTHSQVSAAQRPGESQGLVVTCHENMKKSTCTRAKSKTQANLRARMHTRAHTRARRSAPPPPQRKPGGSWGPGAG